MAAVTTHRSGAPLVKPFTWSYSRLKNFETCPKRHYEIDIAKNFKEDASAQLLEGNEAHAALANRISKNVPLPKAFAEYEPWAARVLAGVDKPAPGDGVEIFVEQKLAITKSFLRAGYFDEDVWFRGVGDVVKIVHVAPRSHLALVIDWKTGKIVEDSVQLALMAQCIFAHYPLVERVRSEFVWLKADAHTREDFSRNDMAGIWGQLWPRIQQLEHAHNTTTYPAKPGGLCRRYCPVTNCPHYGG